MAGKKLPVRRDVVADSTDPSVILTALLRRIERLERLVGELRQK